MFDDEFCIVKVLLQIQEVDPNVADTKGNTLLNQAVTLHNSKCVELLTEVKALDWNQRNMNGETPILIAMRENRTDIVKKMMKCPQVDVSVADHKDWCQLNTCIGKNYDD